MKDSMLEVIQAEIDKLSSAISKLEEERRRVDEKLAPAKLEKEHWQKLFTLRSGTSDIKVNENLGNQFDSPKLVENDEYGARGRMMKDFIMANEESGVTPRTVQDHMAANNLGVSANYVYKTLAKLKEDGVVEVRGGVFRPIRRNQDAA